MTAITIQVLSDLHAELAPNGPPDAEAWGPWNPPPLPPELPGGYGEHNGWG